MIHSERKELWFVRIQTCRSKAALYQFDMAIQGDGASTSDLVCCNVVCPIFRLRLEFDIQERESKLLIRYHITPSKLVVNKNVNCPELIAGEDSLGVSKSKVRFGFW